MLQYHIRSTTKQLTFNESPVGCFAFYYTQALCYKIVLILYSVYFCQCYHTVLSINKKKHTHFDLTLRATISNIYFYFVYWSLCFSVASDAYKKNNRKNKTMKESQDFVPIDCIRIKRIQIFNSFVVSKHIFIDNVHFYHLWHFKHITIGVAVFVSAV